MKEKLEVRNRESKLTYRGVKKGNDTQECQSSDRNDAR